MAPIVASKVDLKPKRHHGYAVLLFIMGTLFPPLAVAARFGIGKDFWLNLLLTICGYIPGHGHNFYIQNIRNNKTHARTPKWAQRYGLVDTSTIERHQRRSQWANRYNDRLPHSTLEHQPYSEGQEQASSVDLPSTENGGRAPKQTNGELWRPEDEQYYNANSESSSGGGRWHYPANFEDAVAPKQSKKGKKEKKDRWARTEDAYSMSEETGRKKKSKKSKKKKGAEDQSFTNDSYVSRDSSTTEFPEDAEGGLYGDRRRGNAENGDSQPNPPKQTNDDVFSHQF